VVGGGEEEAKGSYVRCEEGRPSLPGKAVGRADRCSSLPDDNLREKRLLNLKD